MLLHNSHAVLLVVIVVEIASPATTNNPTWPVGKCINESARSRRKKGERRYIGDCSKRS